MESAHYLKQSLHLRRSAILLAVAWTAAFFLVFVWHLWDMYQNTIESARIQAMNSFEKDLVYRRWAAGHGGVYVPPTKETPPNPYLSHIKNRDISTTSGQDLTLVNPAYMTRQVHELGLEQYGHQGHITSLNPLRSENAPDAWEVQALEAFERGESEVVELVAIGDAKYLRLMRPMLTESSCLKCHAAQGYKVGDLRGGVSVSVPMASLWSIMKSHITSMTIGYTFVWLFGLGGIAFGVSRLEIHLRNHEQAEIALQAERDFSNMIIMGMPGLFYIIEEGSGLFIRRNSHWEEITGYTEEELDELTPLDLTEDKELCARRMQEVFRSGSAAMENFLLTKSGQKIPYYFTGDKLVVDGNNYLVGMGIDITARKQAEEDLHQFECIVSSSTDMMALLNKEYIYLAANDAYLKAFSKSKEEIIGLSVAEVFGEEFFEVVIKSRAEQCMTGQDVHYSDWFKFPVGGRQYMDIVYSPYFGVDQKVRGFVVNGRNITDRMKAEEALKASQERLDLAMAVANDGLWDWDLVKDKVYFDPRYFTMAGYEPEEFPHKFNEWEKRVHPEDLGQMKTSINDFLAGVKTKHDVEFRFLRKDGTWMWIRGRGKIVEKDQNGTPLRMVGTHADITGRKHAEEALRENEEKYRTLVEGSIQGVVIAQFDPLCLSFANSAMFMLTGYTPEELLSMKPDQLMALVHEQDQERFFENFTSRLAGENVPPRSEYRLIRKSGDIVWLQSFSSHIIYFGTPATLTTFVDITGRKHAEEEKARLEEQLRQSLKMESIGRLAGGVAHDFNNILTGINGYAEMIINSLEPDNPLRMDMEEIYRAGKRAAGLTNQLLAFSRKQVIAPRIISPNKILGNSQKMLRRIIGEDIDLVFVPGEDIGSINADPAQLDQVLVNLAVNARDAMPGGGKLTISTQDVEIDEKFSSFHPEAVPGDYVMLTVTDTGFGMDEVTLQKIFEPFFSTKTRDQGTGLGLATVYGIMKQNNGFISVHSQLGAGTTFKVYYPRVEKEEEELSDTLFNEIPTGDETILLVEDEDMVRGLAKKLLERQGYTILEARSGKEAIELCESYIGEIHLLLTDVIMPGMNGSQLQEKLLELLPDLKALFMSGYTEDTIAHHGVLEEDVNFIQKPFAIEALAKQVRSALDG